MQLSANDLLQERKLKMKQNHELYKELLLEVQRKIINRNKTNYKNLVYTFPIIRIGYPLYNIDRAMQYIIMKLNKGGFVAYPYGTNNTLYVDWSIVIEKTPKKKKKVEFKNVEISDKVLEKRMRQLRKKS